MNYLMIIRRPQWKGEDLFGGMSFAWPATVHICLAFLHSCLAVTTVHSFALLHICFSSQLLGFSSQCFSSHLIFVTVAFTHSCFYSQLILLTAAFIHSCLADHSLQFCFSFQCFPSQLLFFIIVAFPRHSAFLHRCFSSSQLLFFTVAWPTTVHSDFSAGSKCVLCTTPSAQWKSFEKPIKTSFITLSQKGGREFKTVPNSFFLKC